VHTLDVRLEAVFSRMDKEGWWRKGAVCTKRCCLVKRALRRGSPRRRLSTNFGERELVHQLYTNPHEQQRTEANAATTKTVNFQAVVNKGKQLRHYGSDFARRRSGVRLPSAPHYEAAKPTPPKLPPSVSRPTRPTDDCWRRSELRWWTTDRGRGLSRLSLSRTNHTSC
jgi:hypothetical protein